MRDSAQRILYIGKAKNLRNRIRSYFSAAELLSPKTRILMRKVTSLEFTVTKTELEALLLECNFIKKHRPRYNVRLKDDKSYPYIVLDFTHPFPQFMVSRKFVSNPKLQHFGPYSGSIRDTARFLLKTFQIRDCSDSKFKGRTRPCLNYEIGTCTAPCVNLVSEEDYSKQVQQASLFLRGEKETLVKKLEDQMEKFSEALEYEKAKQVRDKILAIRALLEKQDIVLPELKQDVDVLGVYVEEPYLQWLVLFVRAGKVVGRRTGKVQIPLDASEAVRSILEQVYTSSLVPQEIWVSEDFPDRTSLEGLLSEQAGHRVRIQVKRGEKALRLLGIAHENAKLVFKDDRRKNAGSAAEALQEVLGLAETPHHIEGIDVSNFQGKSPAVAVIHFADERPLKSRYRLYYPKTVEGQDDFGMIHEVVQRRYTSKDNPIPDLILIDGGKGQLAAALKALQEAGVAIPVCSLAKSRTQSAFTRKELTKTEERIFVPNRKNPIVLREGNPALALLQRVRDEAHRFSVKNHRRIREKWSREGSPLESVKGIGPKTKEILLRELGSLDQIEWVDDDRLKAMGLNANQITAVRGLFTKNRPQEE